MKLDDGVYYASMFGNSDVASIDATELEALPAEAQAFHRRARIVDAAVREFAEHGYDQVAEEAIAERAGVTRRVFYDTFAGKEEALMWAYDVAAAYAVPQILRALRAEHEWERGAAAALTTYLAILDCDRAWALVCLRDVPAAGRRARTARDIVRAPILDALATRQSLPGAGGFDIETMLTAIDAIAVDGLHHDPDQSLLERREELAAFALAPFSDAPVPDGVEAVAVHASLSVEAVEALLDASRTTSSWRSWCARPSSGATGRRCGASSRECGDGRRRGSVWGRARSGWRWRRSTTRGSSAWSSSRKTTSSPRSSCCATCVGWLPIRVPMTTRCGVGWGSVRARGCGARCAGWRPRGCCAASRPSDGADRWWTAAAPQALVATSFWGRHKTKLQRV